MVRVTAEVFVPGAPRAARGFSLIELTISIVLLGIIMAAVAPVFSTTIRGYAETDDHLGTLSKARYATERIARELREIRALPAGGYDFLAPLAPNSMSFRKEDGVVVTLTMAGANLNMTYTPPGITAPLTDELASLNFTYRNALGVAGATAANVSSIEVNLGLTIRGGVHTQRTRVGLRNQP